MTEQFNDGFVDKGHDGLAEFVSQRISKLENLAHIIGGDDATVNEIFPKPTEVRRDAPVPDWTSDQEAAVRSVMHEFGYGSETSVPSGLVGGVRILEGGLIWKMFAEADALAVEQNPSRIIFAGTLNRDLRDDELALAEKRSLIAEDLVLKTEFDAALAIAQLHISQHEARDIAFGYEIAEGNPSNETTSGQLKLLGRTAIGQEVYVLRIDGMKTTDTEGKPKTLFQPNVQRVMQLISEAMDSMGASATEPIGYITSNAYASRQIDAIRAGLGTSRRFGVAMYGRATLSEIKGEPIQPDVELNQLPGEIRVAYENLRSLQDELANSGQQ